MTDEAKALVERLTEALTRISNLSPAVIKRNGCAATQPI